MSSGERLSARELEVLRLIAGGWGNAAIAAALTITTNTVKVHARHIQAKLGAADRMDSVLRAMAGGLIPCPCGGRS